MTEKTIARRLCKTFLRELMYSLINIFMCPCAEKSLFCQINLKIQLVTRRSLALSITFFLFASFGFSYVVFSSDKVDVIV